MKRTAFNHIDTQQSKPYNSSIAANATNGQTVTCKVAGRGQTWPIWKSEQGKKSVMGEVRKHLKEVHNIDT